MPGGSQEVNCVYLKVSVGLKCVQTSKMDSFLNPFALISAFYPGKLFAAVNFMVVFKSVIQLEKRQENEISQPKTNNSRITHTSGDKSRATCIQAFTNHVSF